MELHQALTRSKKIRTVLPRHEQGGAFAAEGYARPAAGRACAWPPVVPAQPILSPALRRLHGLSSGRGHHRPGAAAHDRQGRVPGDGHLRPHPPIVKHSYLITDINDIARVVKEAFYIAQTGRPGPVVIDIPKNIQQQRTPAGLPKEFDCAVYDPKKEADDVALNEIVGLIEKSERPVLYCGGGIIAGNASEDCAGSPRRRRFSDDDHHGCRRVSRNGSPVAALAGHARTAYANWAVSGEFRKVDDKATKVRTWRGFVARIRRPV